MHRIIVWRTGDPVKVYNHKNKPKHVSYHVMIKPDNEIKSWKDKEVRKYSTDWQICLWWWIIKQLRNDLFRHINK
jgi:hypothetical protein